VEGSAGLDGERIGPEVPAQRVAAAVNPGAGAETVHQPLGGIE
jgi:hypothetical protein